MTISNSLINYKILWVNITMKTFPSVLLSFICRCYNTMIILMSFYTFSSMNLNELVLITFLAVCLGFINLNPYAFRGWVIFGVVKILALLINTEDTWEKKIAMSKLPFLHDYFTTFNLRYFSNWLKIHTVRIFSGYFQNP